MSSSEETFRATNKGVVIPAAFVALLLGAIWYSATQHAAVDQLRAEVGRLRVQVENRSQTEQAIDRRLARVEVLLETILARWEREDRERSGGAR